MTRRQYAVLCALAGVVALTGWALLMVSFWLPLDSMREAMNHTAQALLWPGAVGGLVLGLAPWISDGECFRDQPRPLRCIDCGTQVLNAAGSTVGDEIEGELMMLRPSNNEGNHHV